MHGPLPDGVVDGEDEVGKEGKSDGGETRVDRGVVFEILSFGHGGMIQEELSRPARSKRKNLQGLEDCGILRRLRRRPGTDGEQECGR